MKSWLLVFLIGLVSACGGNGLNHELVTMTQGRKTVLWVTNNIGDDETGALQQAGVSHVVVRRGTVNLESSTPVLQIVRGPEVAGGIRVAAALLVETGGRPLDPTMGDSLWPSLRAALGGTPAELVVDMPRLAEGVDGFVTQLSRTSGLSVVPILTINQIRTPRGRAVALAAGSCIVPLFGVGEGGLRGTGQDVHEPLAEVLAPLSAGGVGVRAGMIIRPRTEPALDGWGEGLASLCEDGNVEIQKTSKLGRAFVFSKEIAWSGRVWEKDDVLDIGWMDAARLHSAFTELNRLVLPDIVGWDLVSMPPSGDALGIGREALLAYLQGRGPGPELRVEGERDGRSLTVRVTNTGPFNSAVSRSGIWLEVATEEGALAVRERGDFDSITLGSRKRGEWKPGIGSGADAVRFGETFIGPGEGLRTGVIRLPSSRTAVAVRWRVVLSNGDSIEGFSRF